MSKTKAGGTSKNIKDSPGQRLGVKVFAGQPVHTGDVIVRQIGQTKISGPGTKMGRDYTIYAEKSGVVEFRKTKKMRFSGKTVPRTEVIVS